MNLKTYIKARALRFFFDRIVMRKPAYQIDGIPVATKDETLRIPTPQGVARALLHRPPQARPGEAGRPAVIMFHGGGFVFGLPEHEAPFCRRLANNLDCIVVNPEYVLSPEHPFPHAVRQCYEIVAWLAREAGRLGIDPQRIAVGGHSAGGNLATGVAAQALAKGFPKICFQVLDYPFLDATVAPEDKPSSIANPLIAPGLANLFNSCYMPAGTNLHDPLLSPVCSDKAALVGHPPALVITAEYDTLRAEADRYAGMLCEAGVAVRHEVVAGVDHAFTHNGPKEAADAAWQLIEQCLREAFEPPKAQ